MLVSLRKFPKKNNKIDESVTFRLHENKFVGKNAKRNFNTAKQFYIKLCLGCGQNHSSSIIFWGGGGDYIYIYKKYMARIEMFSLLNFITIFRK